MIVKPHKESRVIYQKTDAGYVGAEPTLIINNWNGMIELKSEDKSIMINHETINDVCRVMKEFKNS